MSSEERDQERGFKVADRRRFSETGEARESTDTSAPKGSAAPEAPGAASTPPVGQPAAETHAAADGIPEINFSTFIIGLSAQALAHLGEIPDPMHQAVRIDLEAARQVIDILGLLRDKTAGNLDSAEAPLLESVLYDLRMKYVERVRGS
jgi:hypothetical protein